MGDSYRTSRVYRERRDDSSDDERYKSTTVTRYKVNPRGDRYERTEKLVEMDDDRRSRYSGGHGRTADDVVEYERRERAYIPDRPRSAFDPEGGDRSRTVVYEREERREPDRDWDRRSRYDRHDDEIRVEKRVEERYDDAHGHEVERYRKETEYYREPEPPSSPVIVRQRAPEQKIIVQEAPPQPIVVPRQEPGVIVLREREAERNREMARVPYDEEYYYRHERREVGPYRGGREHRHRRDDYHSDDDEYYYSRRTVRRDRSESPEHHHKRHLAEGAIAGAGISALLSSRRDEYGDLPENRGKKILAGAALGALGTEAIKRAHSAYEDRWRDGRESPDHHSTLKRGLGLAAVALAAAGAVKYHQASKIEKEERSRGRSRTRDYYSSASEHSRSRSRPRSRRRSISTFAKAALGTAATAGVVNHFRKKSQSRSRHGSHSRHGSRSRSKSKLRRGAELAGAATVAGVAGKLWKDHRDKKKEREASTSRGVSDDDRSSYRGGSQSRSRSRSRSRARSLHSEAGADPELGLVEYGHDPLHPGPRSPSRQGYESEAEERRRRRRRRRERSRSSSSTGSDEERKRSRSRLRNMAAAGAAAIGIKEYKDRKEREKERRAREKRSREREHEGRRDSDGPPNGGYFDDNRPHSPPTASGGAYYPPYPTTPGSAPGGQGYAPYHDHSVPPPREYQPYMPQDYTGYAPPPPPAGPPPPPGPPPPGPPPQSSGPPPPPPVTVSGAAGFAPPPAGQPPHTTGPAPPPAPLQPGPPPVGGNFPPDHVSDLSRSHPSHTGRQPEDAIRPPSTPHPVEIPADVSSHVAKSVSFVPLSPKSSRTMERHRREQIQVVESEGSQSEDESGDKHRENAFNRPAMRRRRSSDTTHDRPIQDNHGRGHHNSDSEQDIEDLPDRFDSQGRPLDGSEAKRNRWTNRSGEFHRQPQRSGDWDVQGAWQISGADQERVERLVRHVTGALEGQRSWIGVLGEVLGEGLLGQAGSEPIKDKGRGDGRNEIEDGDAGDRRHRKRR